MSITRKCLQCDKEFRAAESKVKKGHAKYCCRQCYSIASRGRKLPRAQVQKMVESMRGYRHSGETKRKIGESNRGKKMSAEFCGNVSARQLGKRRGPHSAATKRKISAARKGIKFSAEHRAKLSDAKKKNPQRYWLGKKRPDVSARWKGVARPEIAGENHYRWIADRSQLKKEDRRNDSAYKEWVKSVKIRDGWKCRMANEDCSGNLIAHHILPWRDYPELRYEPKNGITLCEFHHPRKPDEELNMAPLLQGILQDIETIPYN